MNGIAKMNGGAIACNGGDGVDAAGAGDNGVRFLLRFDITMPQNNWFNVNFP